MGSPTRRRILVAIIAVSAACGSPRDSVRDEAPFNPEFASEEMAAFQLGLIPPVDVVSYLASMCACGDFVLIDSEGTEQRVRWGNRMWSGYPPGFTIRGQEAEVKETSSAVQQILGIWFNRTCSLEQEAKDYPGDRSQLPHDSTEFLCSFVFAIAIEPNNCYLLEKATNHQWSQSP